MVMMMLGDCLPPPGVNGGETQEPPRPSRSSRGGILVRTSQYQFEEFCYTSGVRIFVTDAAGTAINATALKGTATFYHPNSDRPWFTRPLRPAPTKAGSPAESLDLAIDLSTVPTSGATVTLGITGLPDPKARTASFTMPFRLVETGPGSAHAGHAANPVWGNTAPPPRIHRYTASGFHRTTAGITVWVPAPGYYYDIPVQSYRHAHPDAAAGWQLARPAPGPAGPVAQQPRGKPTTVHTELYWYPRAWAGTAEHHALMKGQMRQQP
jgi:hypothetical protein